MVLILSMKFHWRLGTVMKSRVLLGDYEPIRLMMELLTLKTPGKSERCKSRGVMDAQPSLSNALWDNNGLPRRALFQYRTNRL